MGATEVSFPTDPAEFDSDDRISFSKLDNKFIAVHDDGNEYEFDAEHRTWTLVDDEPLDEDEAHHSFEDHRLGHRHASETAPRKREYDSGNGYSTPEETTRPARPSKKQKPPPQPRQNTAVYVTGLPLDATAAEVHELFSRKAGVIAEEIDSGAPRIKMYADAAGRFKGDALVVFFKPQSVEMAIMLLDDTDFRFTASGTREGKMRVQAADSSYKKTNYDQDGGGGGGGGGGSAPPDGSGKGSGSAGTTAGVSGNGNGNGSGSGSGSGGARGPDQPRGTQRKDSDRQKIIKKTQKLDAKLADWDDDEDPYLAQAALAASARRDRRVILRHMFTPEELEEDPAALLEIKEDIRDECSKLGAVTNVVLYDLEPEGIVAVRFKDAEAAEACIQLMHGRSFAGRTVEAFWATGKEKFGRSKEEVHDESD